MNEYTNIYYFAAINSIGGIETFFYQLARKYRDRDIVIVYNSADKEQLKRLLKYVRRVKYTGQKIKCKRAFFNFNINIIDNIEAEEYILVIHGDYKDMIKRGQLKREEIPLHDKITKYIAVSKLACDSFRELTGKECEVFYNPYTKGEQEDALKLISATREKGYNRMVELMNRLDERNIPYIWTIFTDSPQTSPSPNVIFMEPTIELERYLNGNNFLVQLSDNEGYCYSVVEALCRHIPVVVTPCPVFKEIGLNESNSITLNMNCSNIDEVIDRMIHDEFDFEYIPKQDNWGKLIGNTKSTYKEEINKKYLVEATNLYESNRVEDIELKRIPKEGEQWIVTGSRLLWLTQEDKYVINKGEIK